jgi:arginyl-tRNA synthetase
LLSVKMSNSPDPARPGVPDDPWEAIVDPLLTALSARLGEMGAPADVESLRGLLDRGGNDHGDLALALHRAAKANGQAPAAFAEEFVRGLPPVPRIVHASSVNGFANFTTDPVALTEATLGAIFARGGAWGHLRGPATEVCVEHTSANPTGPFHVGRVRNGIIGDTLARVLRATGSHVTTQYYVDDVGRQAAMVTWIWSKPPDLWPAEIRETVTATSAEEETALRADVRYGRPYPAVSRYLKTHPDAAAEVQQLSRTLESGGDVERHHEIAQAVLGGMTDSLAQIGIRFDEFVWESSFLRNGDVERVVARLRGAPHAVTEENGASALDATSYGLPKESARIIVTRADGTTLYPTRDIAYHLAKFARFARVIDVLGQDHHLHAKTIDAMLSEIGEARRPEFVIYQDITVPEGGRMSTRQGKVVYLDDLLDEAIERAKGEVRARREGISDAEVDSIARSVGSAAVRYHILRVAPEKTVQFRWEDALSFEGRSGPFLQYSYARASSLLRRAGEAAGTAFEAAQLSTPDERALVRELSRLPGVVAYVARTTHVHSLAGYAHDLAEQFNRFYESTPVLSAGAERASRIALVAASRITLANVLSLLGVDAPERM